jgi:hypothetical protein
VLAASIRHLDHLLCSFALDVELATVPTKVLEEWAAKGFPMPDRNFKYEGEDWSGKAIPYKALKLNRPWDSFDITDELIFGTTGLPHTDSWLSVTIDRQEFNQTRIFSRLPLKPGSSVVSLFRVD